MVANIINAAFSPRSFVPFLLAFIAFFSAAFLFWATPEGPSVHPDSVVYLMASQNIVAGKGYTYAIPPSSPTRVSIFPPGYSLVLAAADLITGNIYRGARVVGLLLFGLSVWLAGMAAWLGSGRNWIAGVLASTIYAVNPVMLDLHGCAISEPLFLPLTLLCVICTVRCLATNRSRDLVVAGLIAGLSAMVRQSGIVWIAAVPLTILLASGKDWRAGFKRAAIAGLVAILPPLLAFVQGNLAGGTAVNRKVGFHMVTAAHLKEGLLTVGSWMVPWRFDTWFTGLSVAAALAVLLFAPAWRSWLSTRSTGLRGGFALTVGVFSGLYLIQLLVGIIFLDFRLSLDTRLLAPVEILVFCAMAVFVASSKNRVWYAAMLLLTVFYGRQSFVLAQKYRTVGDGYRSRGWYASPALRATEALPATSLLWSNKPEGIYISLGRSVRLLPLALHPLTFIPNAEEPAQLDSIVREAAISPGYVIYFHVDPEELQYSIGGRVAPLTRLHEVPLETLKSALHLRELVSGADATLFSIGNVPGASSESLPR